MTKPYHHLRVVLLSLALIVGFACDNSSKPDQHQVLAQIEDHYVTIPHFENAYKEFYYRTGQVLGIDEATKAAILNAEFNTYVMAVFAQDLGLDDSEAAQNQKAAIERRVLTEEYLTQVILSDIEITDAELQDYFVRFNSSLRASHIYAPTREKIDEFYLRLQNGETFEELAKEAFRNPKLAESGGDLGRFTTDDLDIAFENQAFKMKVGEISEPVQTAQGFSIIKLTDRVTKPIMTEYEFNQRRAQLQGYVLKKKEETIARDHLNQFVEGLRFSEEEVQSLWDEIDSNYERMLTKDPEFLSSISEKEGVIAQYNEFSLSMADFVEEFSISSPAMLNTIQDEWSFKNFITGIAYRVYMVNGARDAGIDDQKNVEDSIYETYMHFLADEANQYLRNSISNTEAELYTTYQQNQENFYIPMEINLARVVVASKEEANQVLAELGQGVPFTDLVKKYTINNEDRFTDGELGYESIKNYGFLGTTLAKLDRGDVSEVIEYQANEYHIYQCLGRIEARSQSFAEARDQVNEFVTRKKLQELKATTIEQVKAQHNAVVDLEKLKELSIQI